jgi:hypothetical protein
MVGRRNRFSLPFTFSTHILIITKDVCNHLLDLPKTITEIIVHFVRIYYLPGLYIYLLLKIKF